MTTLTEGHKAFRLSMLIYDSRYRSMTIQVVALSEAVKTPPIVLARSFCRATMLRGPGTKSADANLFMARVIAREPNVWMKAAPIRMIRMRRGVPAIQSRKLRMESLIMTRLYPNLYLKAPFKYPRGRVFWCKICQSVPARR